MTPVRSTTSPLTATVWDRIRDRMERRAMTRYEYAMLARYWRVRRRAMRFGVHHERQLRRAEEDLARAVAMAYIAEKWAPTIRWFNGLVNSVNNAMREGMRAAAPLVRALAATSKEDAQ